MVNRNRALQRQIQITHRLQAKNLQQELQQIEADLAEQLRQVNITMQQKQVYG